MIFLLTVIKFPPAHSIATKLMTTRMVNQASKARRLLAKNAKSKHSLVKKAKLKKTYPSKDANLLKKIWKTKLVSAKDGKLKAPVSAWTTWLRGNRERIKAELTESGGNFLKKAAEMWKKSADEEVRPYEAFAKKAQQKPVSAYGAWLNDNRKSIAAIAESGKGSFLKEAEGMWLTLSDKEKRSYEGLAQTAKKEYEEGSSVLISLTNVENALKKLGHDVPIPWRITKTNTLCFRCKLGPITYWRSTRHLLCQGRKEEVKALLSHFIENGGKPVLKKKKIKTKAPGSPRKKPQISPSKTPPKKRPVFSPAKTPKAQGSALKSPGSNTPRAKRQIFSPTY